MATDLFKTLDTISAFHNYNSWIFRNLKPYLSGTVVDVGSGIGVIANYYKDHEDVTRVVLTDGFDEMLNILKEKFSQDEMYSIIPMDISNTAAIPDSLKNSADCVTCINVLEHIEDHEGALSNMRLLLKNKGYLALMVPALPVIYGSLDTLVGHYRRYTQKTLRSVLQKSGFKMEKLYYMNMFGVISWFIAGRILNYKSFDPASGKRLDSVVPIFEKLESRIKPIIGQSLIAVCRKDEG
jgi:SAM-dependent methyltransferase